MHVQQLREKLAAAGITDPSIQTVWGVGYRLELARQLSLRLRLLAAAAGIVAVSLLLSGALTWVLVRDLELQGAQDQLDRAIQSTASLVRHQECFNRPAVLTQRRAGGLPLADPVDFQDRLTALAPTLSEDRLLLLERPAGWSSSTAGARTPLGQVDPGAGRPGASPTCARRSRRSVARPYLAAAIALAPARDPLGAAFVVLAPPASLR